MPVGHIYNLSDLLAFTIAIFVLIQAPNMPETELLARPEFWILFRILDKSRHTLKMSRNSGHFLRCIQRSQICDINTKIKWIISIYVSRCLSEHLSRFITLTGAKWEKNVQVSQCKVIWWKCVDFTIQKKSRNMAKWKSIQNSGAKKGPLTTLALECSRNSNKYWMANILKLKTKLYRRWYLFHVRY